MTKIMLLVNLLCHRRYVTPEEIEKTCQVSRRTIYRYLNTISAANIPVYYDESVGGYRLLNRTGFGFDSLDLNEAVLILLALRSLATMVNLAYREEIAKLCRKIASGQIHSLEIVDGIPESELVTKIDEGDISGLITRIIIQLGIQHRRKLLIHTESGKEGPKVVRVEDPGLRFAGDWRISDNAAPSGDALPIKKILKVRI